LLRPMFAFGTVIFDVLIDDQNSGIFIYIYILDCFMLINYK